MIEPRHLNRRRLLSLGASIAFLAAALLVWPRAPKEPVYQGKPLTQWIYEAHDVGIFDQTKETDVAIQAMSTDAVPFLLKEFTRPISPWRGRLYGWVNRQTTLHLRTDEARVRLAGNGLILIETKAVSALPLLARYVDDPIRGAFVMDIFRINRESKGNHRE